MTDFTPCSRCGKPIRQEEYPNDMVELENELHVVLWGGYASFIDTATVLDRKPFHLILCERCAVALCDFLGANAVIFHHHTSTTCTCPENTKHGTKDYFLSCECAICTPIHALPGAERHRLFSGGRI